MGTFVENVNQLATDLTAGLILDIPVVADSANSIDVVAANIDSINSASTNLIPNIDEIVIVTNNIDSIVTTSYSIDQVNIIAQDLIGAEFHSREDLGLIIDPIEVAGDGASNIEQVANNITMVNTVGNNISSVNTVALDIANVNATGSSIANVNVVGTNIADVSAVATQVIPNMAEILSVDTNAALVTSLYDSFDDRYLGSKDVEPTLDNDGNAILTGAIYWNSLSNAMYVWTGTIWAGMSSSFTASSTSSLTNKTIDDMSNIVGADHIHYKCRNVSGSTIAMGVVVTAQGTQSGTDYIEIIPVTDPTTQIALGISHTSISNNGTGLVMNTGVYDDYNTSSWTVGTLLYPSTSGRLTVTRPTYGWYQTVAVVLRQHATQGTLLCEFTEPNPIASTSQIGYVQLNNTLTSTSTTLALTAAQGKVLEDSKLSSSGFTSDAIIALMNADATWQLDLGGLV